MKTAYVYSRATGVISPVPLRASCEDFEAYVTANMPEGHWALFGEVDPQSQCVDLATGSVVDYIPPAPDGEHVWVHEDPVTRARVRRWVLPAEVTERRHRRKQAVEEISRLEERQLRIERELRLRPNEIGEDGKTPIQRLYELDARLGALQAQLKE